MQTHNQTLSVGFEFPVVFTRGLFGLENYALSDALRRFHSDQPPRVMVFIDSGVSLSSAAINAYFRAHNITMVGKAHLLDGGEPLKNNFAHLESLIRVMLEAHMDRHSFIMAIGGGALLDFVGCAAALVHRGLRLIRVPTTVLSQNDSGVGVKNGINFGGAKNAIGTFSPPFAVLNDFDFLATLPDREWISGVSEAFKVAIIRDSRFFEFLCRNAAQLSSRSPAVMEELVVRCALLHLDHIRTNGDPFEMGQARPLDFGHWAAHKLESLSNFEILHGEAVSAGILLDSHYAQIQGWLTGDELQAIRNGLALAGLPLWFDQFDHPELFTGLAEFQEHLGGRLCVTFPKGIGQHHEVHQIDLDCMRKALAAMRPVAA